MTVTVTVFAMQCNAVLVLLQDLDLSWNPLGEAALLQLGPILEGGYDCRVEAMDSMESTPSVVSIRVATGLQNLRLVSTSMTPKAAFVVAMGFSNNTTLKLLDCSQNPIGELTGT